MKAGINPIEVRRQAKAADSDAQTFGQIADELIASLTPGFKNAKHREQWKNTIATYAAPLRNKPIAAIDTEDVLTVLRPIWLTKNETASRLRGRIERILDAAKAKGLREGENPARWRGHLDHLLARRPHKQKKHHPAMPFEDVPPFLIKLRDREAVAAKALEFTILCASRTTEVIEAKPSEIDRKAKVWTVPAGRMKNHVEHRVPLTDRALAILDEMEALGTDGYIFPGQKCGKPLSNMAMEMLLRRMGEEVFTVHGFRSSFRDWAGDCTSSPREVAEAALAHTIGNKTEQAYRRADALAKRRKLMEAWAAYLDGVAVDSKVVAISPRQSA